MERLCMWKRNKSGSWQLAFGKKHKGDFTREVGVTALIAKGELTAKCQRLSAVLVSPAGIEPATHALKVRCSTN